jgi:hypothetical protein
MAPPRRAGTSATRCAHLVPAMQEVVWATCPGWPPVQQGGPVRREQAAAPKLRPQACAASLRRRRRRLQPWLPCDALSGVPCGACVGGEALLLFLAQSASFGTKTAWSRVSKGLNISVSRLAVNNSDTIVWTLRPAPAIFAERSSLARDQLRSTPHLTNPCSFRTFSPGRI